MKSLSRDVRGAMTILLCFFLESGSLGFNGIGGPIFDTLGPASPFILIAIFDMALFAFAILLGASGHLTPGDDGVSKEERAELLKQQEKDAQAAIQNYGTIPSPKKEK